MARPATLPATTITVSRGHRADARSRRRRLPFLGGVAARAPEGRGEANEKGLAFYDRLIDALLAAGIEPWLCLYHWDLPQALDDLGGWTSRDSAAWFADYAAVVAKRYGDRVKRFATFNEPAVFTLLGYSRGQHPPGLSNDAALHRRSTM